MICSPSSRKLLYKVFGGVIDPLFFLLLRRLRFGFCDDGFLEDELFSRCCVSVISPDTIEMELLQESLLS